MYVGGMDGCRGGWVLVTTRADGQGETTVSVIQDLEIVLAMIDAGDLAAVAIDIPIGLSDSSPRPVDAEARAFIGPRRSSVFPAPLRGVLDCVTYADAVVYNKRACGKSMSKQTFSLLPKIAAVDRLMTPERQSSVVEVHPEVCFTQLAGAPMAFHKSKPEGRWERLAALRPHFPELDRHASTRRPRTNDDDILDAFVAAWSARRWLTKTHRQLGGEIDRRGLRMEMIA